MKKIIQLKEIDFYYGDFKAIDNITLNLESGTFGLLGPNGAGKTTLLKILLGFLKPNKGHGTILEFDIGQENITMKKKIGYVPETNCIIPGMDGISHTSYLGQLGGMPKQEAMKRAHEVLYYVGLDEARYRNVETYSTGMKQRLKLAAALVHDPELLFLDEPTSGMDPKARKDILTLINDISQNNKMNILISSHILADIEVTCSEIIIINKGQIVKQEKINKAQNRQDIFELKLQGNLNGFKQEFPNLNFHKGEKNKLVVKLPADFDLNLLFRAAYKTKTQIRHLIPRKTSLKDIFISAIGEENHGN